MAKSLGPEVATIHEKPTRTVDVRQDGFVAGGAQRDDPIIDWITNTIIAQYSG